MNSEFEDGRLCERVYLISVVIAVALMMTLAKDERSKWMCETVI